MQMDLIFENLSKLREPIDDMSFIKVGYTGSEEWKEEKQLDFGLIKEMIKNQTIEERTRRIGKHRGMKTRN